VKRRILLGAATLAFAAGLAFAPVAQAQESAKSSEGKAENSQDKWFWWNVVNFVILVGILGYMVKKNGGPYLKTRGEEIQRGMAEAATAQRAADERVAGMERRIAKLGDEIDRMRAHIRQEMAVEGERIHMETEHHIRRINEQAEQEIQSLTKAALRKLRIYSAELALKSAEEQLKSKVDRNVENNLVSSFIDDLRDNGVRSMNN
jgi:F-type H+-transporting ATPase subunit b